MCTFNASMAIKWIIKLDKSLECGPLRGIRRNWFYGVCVSISGNGRRRGSAVWESYEYLLSLSFHVPALVRLVYSVWTANGWEVINVKTCMELLIYIPACAATFTFSTIAFGNGDKKNLVSFSVWIILYLLSHRFRSYHLVWIYFRSAWLVSHHDISIANEIERTSTFEFCRQGQHYRWR